MHWDGTPGWLVGQIWTRSYVFLSLQLDSGPNWEHSNTNPITHQHTQSEISSFRIKVDFFSGFPGMEPASNERRAPSADQQGNSAGMCQTDTASQDAMQLEPAPQAPAQSRKRKAPMSASELARHGYT